MVTYKYTYFECALHGCVCVCMCMCVCMCVCVYVCLSVCESLLLYSAAHCLL